MSEEYEVGYGRPPKATQFKPGESGNPRGRPKGTKNLKTDLKEELAEMLVVREGDQPRKISKQRALLKSLTAKAIKGDVRAGAVVLQMVERHLEVDADSAEGRPLRPEEYEVLLESLRRDVEAVENANACAQAEPEPE